MAMNDQKMIQETLLGLEQSFNCYIDILLQLNCVQEKNQFTLAMLLQKITEKNHLSAQLGPPQRCPQSMTSQNAPTAPTTESN